MRKALALAAALLALSLAGCAAEAPVATPSPTRAAETPTPTPTAEPQVKPALGELVISPEGLGPIHIGQAYIPRDPNTDVLVWDDTFCGFAEDPNADPTASEYGNWKHTYGGSPFDPLAEVAYGATAESPIIRITAFSEELRTVDGLGIGSTMGELQAVYGADLVVAAEEPFFPVVVHGRSGQLVFWFSYESPGEVYMLQVLPDDVVPQWSFHLTACI